tara:strand:- start:184 stop:780 length:597 start_codon:yes stop_codon:yes gene_type:complete
MLTKTQIAIMEVFAGSITKSFSIHQISKALKKPYPLIHRSIQPLLADQFLKKDEHKYLSLDYRHNLSELAYIESSRKETLFKQHAVIKSLFQDMFKEGDEAFFILLVFGSVVAGKKKPNDIDMLLILDDNKKVDRQEKLLQKVASRFHTKFHVHVISKESVYEMLSKRDQLNVMNETLNKHVILFGAENYYLLLNNAR